MINDQKVLSSRYLTEWQNGVYDIYPLHVVEGNNMKQWLVVAEGGVGSEMYKKKAHGLNCYQMPYNFSWYQSQFQNMLACYSKIRALYGTKDTTISHLR